MTLRSLHFPLFLLSATLAAAVLAASPSHAAAQPNLRPESEQILALTNQARAQAGFKPVHWDQALADAALTHCLRMVQEGPIDHRYNNEPDLTTRASQAGAHFSLIEENLAIGPSPSGIHNEWMNSPGHRTNLLSPDIDSIGVAVVASRGVLYAVADYSLAVQSLTSAQIEQRVATLIHPTGVAILPDATLARTACQSDNGMPRAAAGSPQPRFVMRWQDSDLNQLPQALLDHLKSGTYHQAAVGSCPAENQEGSFTAYRLAVLLY
jgi:uncharacterized protein YkwD